jgi:hypothetical protein
MKVLNSFQIGNAAHWTLVDFYEENKVELEKAIEEGEPFTTKWFSCKENKRGRISYLEGSVVVEAQAFIDSGLAGFFEENGIINKDFFSAVESEAFDELDFSTICTKMKAVTSKCELKIDQRKDKLIEAIKDLIPKILDDELT